VLPFLPMSTDTDPSDAPGAKPALRDRLSAAFLKPPKLEEGAEPAPDPTLEELRIRDRFATDKERVIGLLMAPIAALIGILIVGDLMAHNPKAPSPQHVSPSLYRWVTLVMIALAIGMLAAAWFRKRLYLGIAMALFGLTIFNLHYWGFGVPFLLIGAWYLVQAYRSHRDLRDAEAESPEARQRRAATTPSASKRYTPSRTQKKGSFQARPESGRP
jgi:hypothetical protein